MQTINNNIMNFGNEPHNEVQLMRRTSLVHVNFIEPEATLITKDAKVTVPDQVSNIGGTIGIFLGLSTISLLDIIIEQLWKLKKKYHDFTKRSKISRK